MQNRLLKVPTDRMIPQNAKQEPDGSCFFAASFNLDHQGESTGPNDDHKRNAHKEIFHFSSLRVPGVRLNEHMLT